MKTILELQSRVDVKLHASCLAAFTKAQRTKHLMVYMRENDYKREYVAFKTGIPLGTLKMMVEGGALMSEENAYKILKNLSTEDANFILNVDESRLLPVLEQTLNGDE